MAALDLNKCLKQIAKPRLLPWRAIISELPFNINNMVFSYFRRRMTSPNFIVILLLSDPTKENIYNEVTGVLSRCSVSYVVVQYSYRDRRVERHLNIYKPLGISDV